MRSEKGFTLVEVMVAMAIVGVVMAGIYSAYYSQQRSYTVQEQVAEMQQNLRGAMYFMAKEIRMAGCNPTGGADAGIVTAGSNTINFTMDTRGQDLDDPPNGTTTNANENITYALADIFPLPAGDGVMEIVRDVGTGQQVIAENIDALDFVYLDGDGNVTADLLLIRSVQITLVARTGNVDRGYTDTTSYTNLQGTQILAPPNDNFRRKRLATNIKCRNLGLLQE
jgi:type IV pilus assembly protein PilW